MNSGRLKHWILLEDFFVEVDSQGITTESYVARSKPLPAEVVDLSGRELIAASAVASKVSTRITLRKVNVTASTRVRLGDLVYNIEAVTEDKDNRQEWTTLHCTSGVEAIIGTSPDDGETTDGEPEPEPVAAARSRSISSGHGSLAVFRP